MGKSDMYLSLDSKGGAVKGEAHAVGHKDEIEIFEWSWGMTGSQALGGQGRTVKTALSEIRFGKRADRATTQLMNVMRNNDPVNKATLTVCKAGTNPPVDFLIVTVKKGRITSHTIGTEHVDSEFIVEHFAIAFEEIEVKYAPQQEVGSKGGQLVFNAVVNAG